MSDEAPATNPPGPELSPTKRALLALEAMQQRLEQRERTDREPIAIVGMACRFPGAADAAAYWRLLVDGVDAIAEVPPERWDIRKLYHPDPEARGRISGRWGGFLSGLESFDAEFFGISAREAPFVDPRQRLLLEVAWEALEDAGQAVDRLAGTATGVFVGVLTNDYDQLISRRADAIELYTGTGTANAMVANRVSYTFDLAGPSLALDTACSGSLLALHLACQALRTREANLALAGGVAINLLPNGDVFFSRAGSLSPAGRCLAFDQDASGIVRSEGAGLVVLKRLSQALADGDRVYAVVRGSATNHDGRSNGIMAPRGEAQEAVLRAAYEKAGVAPGRVQYVEAHGTGTRVGDPIEVAALAAVLGQGRERDFPLHLGSVKTNLGHMESAAGVAGVMKVALALAHRTLPPTLHFRTLNPLIGATDFPLRVQDRLGAWPATDAPLVAGVNGFGFGGSNVHVVLAEAPAEGPGEGPAAALRPMAHPADPPRAELLLLSAKTPAALQDLARSWRGFLAPGGAGATLALADLAFTASCRRTHHEERLAIAAATHAELDARLDAFLAGRQGEPGLASGRRAEPKGGIAFAFSGQGGQWLGMGQRLAAEEPVFKAKLEECHEQLVALGGVALLDELAADPQRSRLEAIDVVQPIIFAVQVALATLWRSWGVEPAFTFGQSVGEVAAAHVAGALSLADATRVVVTRSRLLTRVEGRGATAAIGLTVDETTAAIAGLEDQVALAGTTGPTSCIISGDPAAVRAVVDELAGRNVYCRLLERVGAAAHSPHMDPLLPELVAGLQGIRPRPGTVPFLSTVTAELEPGERLDADYWARNLRQPFHVARSIARSITGGTTSFLEIGPHPLLAGAIRQSLAHLGANGVALPSLRRDEPERETLLTSLGELWARGHALDARRWQPAGGRVVSLPNYPWQRQRHWLDLARVEARHGLLGESFAVATPPGRRCWQSELDARSQPWLADHRVQETVVFPAAAYLEMALAAGHDADGAVGGGLAGQTLVLSDVGFEALLLLPGERRRQLQLVATPVGPAEREISIHSRELAGEGSEWTRHATARRAELAAAPAPPRDLAALAARAPEPMPVAELYAAMAKRGIHYGPAFAVLREIRRGPGRVLARVELEAVTAAEAATYHLHPCLLDAAFQSVAAILDAGEGEAASLTYLPRGLGRLELLRAGAAAAWCAATMRAGCTLGDPELLADLELLDEHGAPIARVAGLVLRRLDAATVRERSWRELTTVPVWREQAPPPAPALPAAPGRWLIFADRGGFGRWLGRELEARGERVELTPLAPLGADRERIAAALTAATASQGPPLRGLVHLGALDLPASDDLGPAELEAAMAAGCGSVLALVQARSSCPAAAGARLVLVTRDCQPVAPGPARGAAPLAPLRAMLWGLGRVLALELGEAWGGLVDLDSGPVAGLARALADELLAGGGETLLAFRHGRRFVARLARHQEAGKPLALKPDGAYLVTGGLRGLGLETAFWLAEHGARRLLLLARSPLPERSSWAELAADHPAAAAVAAVRRIESLGTAVELATFDVADEAALTGWLAARKRQGLPPLRGVVHAAGLVQDQLATQMDSATFAAVARPKVQGSFLLHRATLDDPLDFFVLYSSMSSLFGQLGQANYAAANAFEDCLAHARQARGLPGLAIHWGPWSEVGIYARLDAATRRGIDMSGVAPISPAENLAVLGQLLGGATAEVLVADADWRRLPPVPFFAELQAELEEAATTHGEGEGQGNLLALLLAEPAERLAGLVAEIRAAAAKVLRTDAARLPLETPLTALGMDSIMAVELKNAVRRELEIEVAIVDLFTASIERLAEILLPQLDEHPALAALLDQVESLSLDETRALLDEEPAMAGGGEP